MPIHNNQPPGQGTTPRPAYVPGSNPATANQGYTAQDFWDGKAGFGAGWGGAEKQEWLQNNMAPITGHNYIPDTSAHQAAVQAQLQQNKDAVMAKMQANPGYQAAMAGGPGTGTDVKGDNRSYIERQGGMYGSGMSRQGFASGLTTGDPAATAAAAANTAKWKDPAFLDSYYKSILSPEDYAKWKAQQGNGAPSQGSGGGFGTGGGDPNLQSPVFNPPQQVGPTGPSPTGDAAANGMGAGGSAIPSPYPGGGTDAAQPQGPQSGASMSPQPIKPPTMPGGNPGYTGIAGRMWQGGSGMVPPGTGGIKPSF